MITLIIFIVIIMITCFPVASGVSTIKVGDRLNLNSQLVSPGRRFTLGFFTIPETDRTYLGIWYTHDRSSTKVWVANRATPVISSSSVLMIDPDTGKLIIATGGAAMVSISDNQSGPTPNMTATLQETGDFQLKSGTDDRILWKSFDYPTNVLLPGMKLGWDSRTGRNWELTSWLNEKLPDLGAFTMSFEANGTNSQRLMIRRRGQPYWSKLAKELDSVSRYRNLSYAYNNEERYFSYAESCRGNGCNSLWILNTNGQIEEGPADSRYLWRTEFCYGFDSGDGCAASSDMPMCRSGDDKFTLLTGEFIDGVRLFIHDHSILCFSDCMVRCLNDCECLAFNTPDDGVGCNLWKGHKSTKFETDRQVISVPKYVLVSTIKGKILITDSVIAGNDAKILIWALVVSGCFQLLFCFGLLWYRKNRKLKQQEERRLLELMSSNDTKRGGRKGSDMVVFSSATLLIAVGL